MVDFKAKKEYTDFGKVMLTMVDHPKISARGLVVLANNQGYEIVLFRSSDEDTAKCEKEGWTVPLASGTIKNMGAAPVYWVKAYSHDSETIACKLSFAPADKTQSKMNATMFWVKDCDGVMEGKIQAPIPF